VHKLTAAGAASTSGVTYAGYDYQTSKPVLANAEGSYNISTEEDGTVTVSVFNSEALVIKLANDKVKSSSSTGTSSTGTTSNSSDSEGSTTNDQNTGIYAQSGSSGSSSVSESGSEKADTSTGLSEAAKIAIPIAVVAGIIILVLLSVCCICYRRSRSHTEFDDGLVRTHSE